MRCYLQLLDLSPFPVVCLVFESHTVLFNCPEGTQRMLTETCLRVSKFDLICLTQLSPQSVSGLPGMTITANEVQKKIKIVGPRGTEQYGQAWRHFVALFVFLDTNDECRGKFVKSDLKMEGLLETKVIYEDKEVIIEAIVVERRDKQGRILKKVKHSDHNQAKIAIEEAVDSVIFYIGTIIIPAKIDSEKLKRLQIPKGPLTGTIIFYSFMDVSKTLQG